MRRDTIVDRFVRNAEIRGTQPAVYWFSEGRWDSMDWRAYVSRARDFAGALLAMGYTSGEAVAIVGNNCPEWVIADVGTMIARGVPAGIYPSNTAEQMAYVAAHCEARVVVAEDATQWTKLDAQRAALPKLEKIVMIRDAASVSDPRVVTFEAFCQSGRAHLAKVDARFAEIQDDDLATLIYTSGTTGPPKGAMLSHRNLAAESTAAISVADTRASDCVVSYLPLSHIAEQMFTIHLAATAGYAVWFAESMAKLREALLAARPTVFLGVPRVWEKLKGALEPKLAEATGAKAAIVRWSREVGRKAGTHRIEYGPPSGLLAVQERIARRLFFSKLAAQLGLDRMRAAVSGAAPIGRDVLEFFLSCGIIIREVYGQTEGTGASTFNRLTPGETRIGTVGRALPGIEVKLAADGEILVKGPTVFLGYYKDPEATRATLIDGYLHSGDVGEFDDRGFLRITDRKKDLIITSGGKNVAPQNIEKLLRNIDGIGQAVVIGDRRKFLIALLTIDPEKSAALARTRGWPADRLELVRHPAFVAHVQTGIDSVNRELARYESVKKFELLADDFTQESGELTPTQKVKRKVVLERYARRIDEMYAESSAGPADA